MVKVTLRSSWTDPAGTAHHAGEVVDVDAATAEQLAVNVQSAAPSEEEQQRFLGPSWAGPSDDDPEWES